MHLLGIVNTVLELSKIEAGKRSLRAEPVALPALFAEVQAMLAGQAQEKGLDFTVDRDLPAITLLADATALRQALLNYAANAIKFTTHGAVQLSLEILPSCDQRQRLRFSVRDTGVGIAAEILPRLFTPFEQGDNSTTRAYGGTGLGLAITRRLAEMMGGTAGASSQPGVGSTFWFTVALPSAPAPENSPDGTTTPISHLPPHLAGKRILVVDDEPINREIAGELLSDEQLQVLSANDGEAALALLQANASACDLILMDMQMPRLDGLSATRRIRDLPGGERLPIIAMTANAFAEDRARCLAAGMDDFIAKPIQPAEFYATLARWLDREGST